MADRFPVRVTTRDMLTAQIASFELVGIDQRALPPYQAGAHIEVDIRPGLIRRYSLCGDPHEGGRYRIAVQRDPQSRGGSQTIHSSWAVGDIVTVSAPRNNFPLTVVDAPTILVAGGIGITPILAMAFELAQRQRPFELHYTARSASAMAFHQRLANSPFRKNVRFYFDDASDDQRFSIPRLIESLSKGSHIYVCGPTGLNSKLLQAAYHAGFQSRQLHQETFAVPKSDINNQPFTVEIASTQERFTIPANQTVLETLEQNGIFIPNMCRQGICGICITNVLCGSVDHRDDYLTPDERAKNDAMLPCCSRAAAGHLVLDV